VPFASADTAKAPRLHHQAPRHQLKGHVEEGKPQGRQSEQQGKGMPQGPPPPPDTQAGQCSDLLGCSPHPLTHWTSQAGANLSHLGLRPQIAGMPKQDTVVPTHPVGNPFLQAP
jgi:hypothetical protein